MLLSVSVSGIQPVQTPVESLLCPKLTRVLPPRGREEKKTQVCKDHLGGPYNNSVLQGGMFRV